MPVGRINAAITARAGESTSPDAKLQVLGAIIGNFDLSPESIFFNADTTTNNAKILKQTVKVFSTTEEAGLHILGIKDEYDRLTFHVDTLQAGKEYEITATPTPALLATKKNVSGIFTITTDDAEQPVASVTFAIYFGH